MNAHKQDMAQSTPSKTRWQEKMFAIHIYILQIQYIHINVSVNNTSLKKMLRTMDILHVYAKPISKTQVGLRNYKSNSKNPLRSKYQSTHNQTSAYVFLGNVSFHGFSLDPTTAPQDITLGEAAGCPISLTTLWWKGGSNCHSVTNKIYNPKDPDPSLEIHRRGLRVPIPSLE